MLGELFVFLLVLGVVIVGGGIVGMLAARRLTGWQERQEESDEGED
jgi:hypothetical protein